MKRSTTSKLCGALALCFAAATAQAQQAPGEYVVVSSAKTPAQTMMLPEMALPAPGPQRDQVLRYAPMRAVEYRTYLLLLRDAAGNYAQCAGLDIGTNPYYYNGRVGGGDVTLQTNDRDALQILRRGNAAQGFPARLGGCVAISDSEAAQVTANHVGVRIGSVVEGAVNVPLYGRETPAETQSKADMVKTGRGVALQWASGACGSPAGGWNESHYNAAPGQKLALPGLCPR